MNTTLIYTLPQWFIFAAVFGVTYGWIEKKRTFRVIGAITFVLLGIFSLFILSGDFFTSGQHIAHTEIVDKKDGSDIPFQAKLLPAYLSFVLSAILALVAIFFDLRKSKKYRWFIIFAGLTALYGFFAIAGALKSF